VVIVTRDGDTLAVVSLAWDSCWELTEVLLAAVEMDHLCAGWAVWEDTMPAWNRLYT
jgi:hypothetical protein